MDNQLQHKIYIPKENAKMSTAFIMICSLAFVISVTITIYFCISMGGDMSMPGGWTMSMMWMRMPDETWFTSSLSFILMWLTMMVAMMIPSALPMFLKIRRQWNHLCYTAIGYFTIWLLAGIGFYILGVMFANAAMQSEFLSNAVPFFFGVILVLAGTYQFTRLKITNLLHCRSPFGCGISTLQHETSFQLGCKQGIVCFACCSGLMTAQLILGIMNPLIMATVAIAITVEKLLPRPIITVRLIGIAAIIAGITTIIHWAMLNYN